jgi:hypothetical protein
MYGPDIIARSMSALKIPDKFGNEWQYHSQSDRHSKIACWALMFDLLAHCGSLKTHVEKGKIGFGINHELRDFRTGRKKNLDLVICTPNPGHASAAKRGKVSKAALVNFADLASEYEVLLTSDEKAVLCGLPELKFVPVGSVCVALEAKAAMTEHIKALPRLHDELDSSHTTVHGAADHSVAAALVTVNIASHFRSPGRNKFDLKTHAAVDTVHTQPKAAEKTIGKVAEIRRRSVQTEQGFDAIGIMVVDFKNDGSKLRIVSGPPAPAPGDNFHYNKLVERICSLYGVKFSTL